MNRFDGWNDELCHHGIPGQKWGIRKYQNSDGTLTEAGKARYLNADGSLTRKGEKAYRKEYARAQRLVNRADLNRQRALADMHGQKAKKAGKQALISAGSAALTFGGSQLGGR